MVFSSLCLWLSLAMALTNGLVGGSRRWKVMDEGRGSKREGRTYGAVWFRREIIVFSLLCYPLLSPVKVLVGGFVGGSWRWGVVVKGKGEDLAGGGGSSAVGLGFFLFSLSSVSSSTSPLRFSPFFWFFPLS